MRNRLCAWTIATVLLVAIPGCAMYGKCGNHECPEDAQTSAEVRKLFAQYPNLQSPNILYVQTRDHVVTLTGMVNTDYDRRLAESVALQASGVTRVNNLLGTTGGAR